MAEPRNQGSTVAGYIFSGLLVLLGLLRIIVRKEWCWNRYQVGVEVGSCFLFALVLFFWARSKTLKNAADHHQDTWWNLGFESVTMLVGVVTAVVAILTLTDAASKADAEKTYCKAASSEVSAAPNH